MDVIIFSHTHWDREWYKPFQDFRIRLVDVMEELFVELDNNQINVFYLDGQTVILEDYLELYPERLGKIKQYIKEKRLFIGPWYILADEFLVSGESLTRNLLIGIHQAKSLGCKDYFGYMPDSFGHPSNIPQILSAFDIKNAVLWRGAGNNNSEFIWKGQDNSSILTTYLTEGYFNDIFHSNISTKGKAKKLKEVLDKIKAKTTSDKILLTVGGDHLGIVPNLKDLISQLNQYLPEYQLAEGRIENYLNSLKKENLITIQSELRDNSRNPILPSVYSTRIYLKQLNAITTWKLSRIAEPLQTLLQSINLTKQRTNELNFAWKLLLKNQPHDSICGCSVDEVHEENVSRFKQVNQISNSIIDRCMNDIANNTSRNEITVCNLSNFNYTGLAKLTTNKPLPDDIPNQLIKSNIEFPKEILLNTQRVPFSEDLTEHKEYLIYTENLPAFSIKAVSSMPTPKSVEITDNEIRNSLIKINITTDGTINLTDLKTNKTFKNLHIITDRTDLGDSYNFSPQKNDIPIKAEIISSEIKEKGPLRATLKLNYKLKETIITTEASLSVGSKRVELNTYWKNTAKNHTVKVKFNLPEKITDTVSENNFGLITRQFNPDYRLENHIPAEKGKELKTNTAPMQRFVYTQGLGVITEGLPEYLISGNSLSITLLRSIGKLSGLSLDTRGFPAGPAVDTPKAQCLGEQNTRYAICLPDKPQDLFKQADEFMGSVKAALGTSKQASLNENLLSIENENILVYAIKPPVNLETNCTVIRLVNISDSPQITKLKAGLNCSNIIEANALEEPKQCLGSEIEFKANELKTILLS